MLVSHSLRAFGRNPGLLITEALLFLGTQLPLGAFALSLPSADDRSVDRLKEVI